MQQQSFLTRILARADLAQDTPWRPEDSSRQWSSTHSDKKILIFNDFFYMMEQKIDPPNLGF